MQVVKEKSIQLDTLLSSCLTLYNPKGKSLSLISLPSLETRLVYKAERLPWDHIIHKLALIRPTNSSEVFNSENAKNKPNRSSDRVLGLDGNNLHGITKSNSNRRIPRNPSKPNQCLLLIYHEVLFVASTSKRTLQKKYVI